MEFFVVFKYLHIVSMFFGVALAVSTELVLRRVATSGDVRAIRTTAVTARPLSNLATLFFVAGVVFGLVAAITGQFNLLAPWLLLSYAAFVAASILGFLVTDPWAARLEAAAVESVDEAPSERLIEVIGEPAARAATWAMMALMATLVFLMVVKPFS